MKFCQQDDYFIGFSLRRIMKATSDCTVVWISRLTTVDLFFCRAAVDTILSITYGITPTDFEHPFIKAPEDLNAIFADVAKGGYMGLCRFLFFSIDEYLKTLISRSFPFLEILTSMVTWGQVS